MSNKLGEMGEWGITLEQAIKFIAMMVSPSHLKSSLTEPTDIALHKDFYS